MPKLLRLLAWAALFAGLCLPTPTPEIANVTTLVLIGVGVIILMARPSARAVLRLPVVTLPLAAGALLLLALVITAKSPLHVLVILVLAPLWFAGGHAALLGEIRDRLTPAVIGSFALAGTAIGAGIAAFDVIVRQVGRGGSLVNNPIHLADLTLMLGFVALVGLFDRRPLRVIFLAGPALVCAAIGYTGARGALVALVPMLVIGGGLLAFLILPRRRAWQLVALGVAGIIVALGATFALGLGGRISGLLDVALALVRGEPTDGAVTERLSMYQTAWNAFQASPWFGFGMIDFTTLVAPYMPPQYDYAPSGHLHNDIADFAVIGGVLGLACYGLLLAAPLVGGLSARGPNRGMILYLGVVTSLGYFTMGLTNAMFGILTQTVLYGVILSLMATLAAPAPRDMP
ncbi:O-antigen ligase family protein [Devosia aquimaris]|uniref:O-antigen ligase family protein n=1 Tax=Devosia aquimaris TaxID=2866214 RepID=UPI001CD0B7B9|nr:O-antigen ligase family protein [Devosia sp. CJK-A8-3]